MIQTTELLVAIFKSINSWVAARADDKIDEKDLGFLLPLFFAWQAGIKDLTFFQEAVKATPESIDKMFLDTANRELSVVTPRTKYVIREMFKGAYVSYWAIAVPSFEAGARYTMEVVHSKGKDEGLAQVKAEIAKLSAA